MDNAQYTLCGFHVESCSLSMRWLFSSNQKVCWYKCLYQCINNSLQWIKWKNWQIFHIIQFRNCCQDLFLTSNPDQVMCWTESVSTFIKDCSVIQRMSVGWDVKWCPVSRITNPLAHKRFRWGVGYRELPEKLKNVTTDYFKLEVATITWLKYCRYGVKHYPINQSM